MNDYSLVFAHIRCIYRNIRQMGLYVCSTFRLRYAECEPGLRRVQKCAGVDVCFSPEVPQTAAVTFMMRAGISLVLLWESEVITSVKTKSHERAGGNRIHRNNFPWLKTLACSRDPLNRGNQVMCLTAMITR